MIVSEQDWGLNVGVCGEKVLAAGCALGSTDETWV